MDLVMTTCSYGLSVYTTSRRGIGTLGAIVGINYECTRVTTVSSRLRCTPDETI